MRPAATEAELSSIRLSCTGRPIGGLSIPAADVPWTLRSRPCGRSRKGASAWKVL